ncbi:MAG: 4-(cytidine 5'-diphospho)-2-C-methyl-D-erythritol kinase, partial [Treponema sp.]|nr:4-(cytidine 5'-diphospho)-2-C-methyl-D-erythritol kinase [Treponema sp.]
MEEGTEYSGRIEAPCKINLHLSVGGRRPDGFHELESLFVTLDYGDTLELELTGTGGAAEFSMCWDGPGPAPPELASLPPEKNLVYRALSLFREKTGFTRGLRGRGIKRIPPGSGYGGGSSDAAAALLALDSLSGGALGPGALPELAAALGSDAPFFLRGGAALVRGRGERLEAL